MTIEQLVSLLLGILIVGEAILLFIGLYLLDKTKAEWKTNFNTNTLLMDIAFGVIIVFNAFEPMTFIWIAVLALLITHLYREAEYFYKDKKTRFLFNPPLFILNSIKLLGLVLLVLLLLV